MKILIISSAAIPSPPEGYSGLEAITSWLAMEFAKNGNDVTLVTTQGSPWEGSHPIMRDNVQIGTMNVIGTVEPSWDGAKELDHYNAYKDLVEREFSDGNSVILDNTWFHFVYLSKEKFPNMNVVGVHHGMLGFRSPPPVLFPRLLGLSTHHAHYMSTNLNVPVRHINNGIPLVQFPQGYDPTVDKGNYLLSLNRITDEKGIVDSIDVAIATNTPIVICGDDTHVVSQEYVNTVIERCRHSGGLATFLGLVDSNTKNNLILKCKALIGCAKPTWQEAFGLYVCEGLAYYKPFLGLAGGIFFKHGYNDVIQQGVNGFIAQTPEELKQYVEKIDDINPINCRQTIEQRFTKEVMASNYLTLCQKIIDKDLTVNW
jgi:glycosyltransferase involved in cell wall biosynthesis